MKKAIKIIFVAALIAMVMALTSCGLSSDKQGTYLPAKLVYSSTSVPSSSGTYVIDWNNKTVTKNGAASDYNAIPLSVMSMPNLKIKATKANDSKSLS